MTGYTSSGAGWWDEEDFVRLRAQGGGTPQNVIALRMREGKPGGGKGPLLSDDASLTLAKANDQVMFTPQAFNWQTGRDGRLGYGDMPTALQREQTTAVQTDSAVRRLTPVECSRLQGFSDDWLGGNEPPDSPKYAALGDAVTVPVAEWIGRRLNELRSEQEQ